MTGTVESNWDTSENKTSWSLLLWNLPANWRRQITKKQIHKCDSRLLGDKCYRVKWGTKEKGRDMEWANNPCLQTTVLLAIEWVPGIFLAGMAFGSQRTECIVPIHQLCKVLLGQEKIMKERLFVGCAVRFQEEASIFLHHPIYSVACYRRLC